MSFLKGHNKHLYSFCSLLPRQTYICYSLYSSLLQNLVFNFLQVVVEIIVCHFIGLKVMFALITSVASWKMKV